MKRLILLIIFLPSLLYISARADNFFQIANDLLSQGKYQQSVETYQKFAQQNPANILAPTALFNSANIFLLNLNDAQSACKIFITLTQKYPSSKFAPEAYRRLAEIADRQGNSKSAADFYRLSLISAKNGDFQMAEYWFNEITDNCQTLLLKIKDPVYTIELYREIADLITAGDKGAECRYRLAQTLKETGKPEESAQVMAEMMYSVPVSRFTSQVMREERDFISQYLDFPWDILQEISQLPGKFQQGKYEEGRSIIKNLLPQVKNSKLLENLEYSLIVSDVYCDEDFETGLSRLQDYADKYPKGLRANDVQNQIAFFSEVLQIKDRIVEDPEDFSSHQQLGYLFLQRRIDVLAEKEFMLALKDTTLDDTYLGLGYVYLRTNRPEEAVIYLEIYLSRHPEDGDTFNRIGYAYLQTNRMENALRCFLKYVELEPTNPNSHDSYAECLMNMGRNEEAIAEYKKALELNPNWSNGFYMLGEIYRGMGNKEEAVVYYQRYLDMDPGGVQSQNAKTQIETLTKDQ